MEDKNILERCYFYELKNADIYLCAYIPDKWEDSFVILLINSEVFILHGEKSKSVIANISANDIFIDSIHAKKLSELNAPHDLKEIVKNYLKNKNNENI